MHEDRLDVSFVIGHSPVAKGRPRFGTVAGHARAFTPKKTRKFESYVRDCAAAAFEGMPPLDEPLQLDVLAVLQRPKRLMRKKDPRGLIWCDRRPDLDNLVKAVKDGMDCVWRDDACVVQLTARKAYTEMLCKPRVEVRVRSLRGCACEAR